MIDFAELAMWVGGGVTVVGIIQWLKGLAPKIPTWVWSAMAPLLAVGYAVAPSWARQAAGVLAISQIGYETIIQGIRKKLGGGT